MQAMMGNYQQPPFGVPINSGNNNPPPPPYDISVLGSGTTGGTNRNQIYTQQPAYNPNFNKK